MPIICPVTLSAVISQYQPGQNWHVGQCKTKPCAALLSVPLIATRPALRNASRARNVLKGLFKCNQCRAEFTENANLSRHRRTMHAAVPSVFVCHICTRTFNRSDNMHMHIKNVHGGGSVVASKWSTLQLQTCPHGRTCLVSSGALQCADYHMWWLGRLRTCCWEVFIQCSCFWSNEAPMKAMSCSGHFNGNKLLYDWQLLSLSFHGSRLEVTFEAYRMWWL